MPYRQQAIENIVTYAIENPEISYVEICSLFGYPKSPGILKGWTEKDPRFDPAVKRPRQSKASFTEAQKEEIVEYVISHPDESLESIRGLFGYPKTISRLHAWAKADPRFALSGRRKVTSYPEEFRARVVQYLFDHPEESLEAIAEHFNAEYEGLSWASVRGWAAKDPRWNDCGRANYLYTDEEKKRAVDYVIANPGVRLADACKELGYPAERKALSSWVKLDPRYAEYRHARGIYTADERASAVAYAISNPELSQERCVADLGYPSLPTLQLWLREAREYESRYRVHPEDEKGRVLDYYFKYPEKSAYEVGVMFGGVPANRVSEWARRDPRWPRDDHTFTHTQEQRDAAVAYYNEHPEMTYEEVCSALGYPGSPSTLEQWARDARSSKVVSTDKRSYSSEFKALCVDYYFDHPEKSQEEAAADLGISSGSVLWHWASADPRFEERDHRRAAKYPLSDRAGLVTLVMKCDTDLHDACSVYGVSYATGRSWCRRYEEGGIGALLNKGDVPAKSRRKPRARAARPRPDGTMSDELRESYEREIAEKDRQLAEAEFENDILRGIIEILKKGIDLSELSEDELSGLSNKEKTLIIESLRPRYPLKKLLSRLSLGSSSYKYCRSALSKPDKYQHLRACIHEVFEASGRTYGYRRVNAQLRKPAGEVDEYGMKGYGVEVSEKVVRRIMQEEGLIPYTAKIIKKFSSYRGPLGKIAPNLIGRDFYAERPWQKLLTDITEFRLNGFKVYLSPLIDCYNGEVVSYAVGTSPNMTMVMKMMNDAMEGIGRFEKGDEDGPIVHSDQGFHYQLPVFVNALKENGYRQSMSRKGCCSDNSACEGFFGRLKNEFFYSRSFVGYTPEMFIDALGKWIDWHNNGRIMAHLGYLSPVQFREAGLLRERTAIQRIRKAQREGAAVEEEKLVRSAA